jgi:predicted lipoprotein with Yx(FWY)xxD motif
MTADVGVSGIARFYTFASDNHPTNQCYSRYADIRYTPPPAEAGDNDDGGGDDEEVVSAGGKLEVFTTFF